MHITILSQRSKFFSLLGVVILLGALFITVNNAVQQQQTSSHASVGTQLPATNCQPNAILVNPCRPWFGAAAKGNPNATADPISQYNYLEQVTGRSLDIFHDYHPAGNLPLNSDEIHFAQRANTYIYVNWKPAGNWADAGGGNATVNAQIDKAAANIKAIAPHKIFLTVWHEPQNDVSPGTSNCPNLKGGAGSPAQYKAMWQNVRNRFNAAGVTNVVWVMNYQGYAPFDCLIPQLWPGNNLVDWVAYDTYAIDAKPNWNDSVGRVYNVFKADQSATTDFASKPWAVGEYGTCNLSNAPNAYTYYQSAKAALDANEYPNLKMYMIYADTGNNAGPGCLTNTTITGAADLTRQTNFNQFANDPIFANGLSSVPTITTIPLTAVPTPKPTQLVQSSPTAANCQPNAILVNPCRPLLGAAAMGNPKAASDPISQFTYLESLSGHPMDIFHDYHPVGNMPLNSFEIHFATRPNTYSYVNWKPASNWADAGGGNAAVNAQIDHTAANIKAIAPAKIFLTVWHEPENDVSPGTSTCPGLKGSSGSPAQYKAMWQNIRNRFNAAGVNNVVWVMNYMSYAAWDCLVPEMWPGNNLVDWVTYDSYSSSDSSTWDNTVGRFYNLLVRDNSSTTNFMSKPWGLGEWGDCLTADQAHVYQYYQQAKAALDANTYPNLKMYLIFADTGNNAGPGCLTNYSKAGVYDPTEQSYYNLFVNDPNLTKGGSNVPTITAAPTAIVTPTATPMLRPTSVPTGVLSLTPTPVLGSTMLNIVISLQGIGNGGDSANPHSHGNDNPHRQGRKITIEVYNAQNQLVVTQQGTVSFDRTSGVFIGSINLGQQFLTGAYTVKIKSDQYLRVLVPGIQTITAGQTTTLPSVDLVTGDVNGDNAINILDFNDLMGCYSDLLPATNCSSTKDVLTDLNDDGQVNAFDYNLFLREMTNVGGE